MTEPQVYRHPHVWEHLTHRAAIASTPEGALEHLRKQNVPNPSLRQLEFWNGEKWVNVTSDGQEAFRAWKPGYLL